MQSTTARLLASDFLALSRTGLKTLQLNLGYKCNMSCVHCHVNASPHRTESMSAETVAEVIELLPQLELNCIDLTGGAPELNPHFRELVTAARSFDLRVIDRCNLTILFEDGQEDLAQFLADNEVNVVASLPCYLEDNVTEQRGKGAYDKSIRALQLLNELGYGTDPKLELDLVFNPIDAVLPPNQLALQRQYKDELGSRFGIVFDKLFAITNMPINRFGAVLLAHDRFDSYMKLLTDNFDPGNLDTVMCRDTISVDWQGNLYDCDFNQMLSIPIQSNKNGAHLSDLRTNPDQFTGRRIRTARHCYGCTAGQGSSCTGALGNA